MKRLFFSTENHGILDVDYLAHVKQDKNKIDEKRVVAYGLYLMFPVIDRSVAIEVAKTFGVETKRVFDWWRRWQQTDLSPHRFLLDQFTLEKIGRKLSPVELRGLRRLTFLSEDLIRLYLGYSE